MPPLPCRALPSAPLTESLPQRLPPAADTAALDRYCRNRHAFLYASCRFDLPATARASGVLLVGLDASPFTVTVGRLCRPLRAALVQPHARRGLRARGQWVVSLNVHPTHALYRRFGAIEGERLRGAAGGDGVQAVEGAPPPATMALLQGLCSRGLSVADGAALVAGLLQWVDAVLPPPPPPDVLRAPLLALLQARPDAPLAELAAALGLSYHRLSHRFRAAMGLSLRQWQAWARTQRAVAHFEQPLSLTGIAHEAGYSDSAHLSRTWQRLYGLSPSYLRSGNSVQATF